MGNNTPAQLYDHENHSPVSSDSSVTPAPSSTEPEPPVMEEPAPVNEAVLQLIQQIMVSKSGLQTNIDTEFNTIIQLLSKLPPPSSSHPSPPSPPSHPPSSDVATKIKEHVIDFMLKHFNISFIPDSVERELYETLFDLIEKLIPAATLL
jgi:hypothetical protein